MASLVNLLRLSVVAQQWLCVFIDQCCVSNKAAHYIIKNRGRRCSTARPSEKAAAKKRALTTVAPCVARVKILVIIIIIIQLYFRPQCVHRKDNTKYADHINITKITKYALNMSAYHSSVRLYKVAIHLLFNFDATCTSLLITLCVIKLRADHTQISKTC